MINHNHVAGATLNYVYLTALQLRFSRDRIYYISQLIIIKSENLSGLEKTFIHINSVINRGLQWYQICDKINLSLLVVNQVAMVSRLITLADEWDVNDVIKVKW